MPNWRQSLGQSIAMEMCSTSRCSCCCLGASVGATLPQIPARIWTRRRRQQQQHVVRALVSGSAQEDTAGFINRMEQAWLISKQPKPVACSSCKACGKKECPWCKGTGFFILGDNMLCEVSSRNTSCYICSGQGVLPCDQCKGTGYRAKWLGQAKRHPDETAMST